MDWSVFESALDRSVNFTHRLDDGGMFECRYVRRDGGSFIVYLSSHSGCNQACRFCHLTQTAQTMFRPATIDELIAQAERVFEHYAHAGEPARTLNINFMARGEPLLNPHLVGCFHQLVEGVEQIAATYMLEPRFYISSIFPESAQGFDLVKAFSGAPVTFFWSVYSLDQRFRSRWLPKAADPVKTMKRLLDWQAKTGREVVIHHALIRGENDGEDHAAAIAEFVRSSGLKVRLNLVRYNPFSERAGQEASDEAYEKALQILGEVMEIPGSKIIQRVGFDVKASCGMFMV